MKRLIETRAHALGFDACRVASAEPPESGPVFQEWLAEGRHGEMGYLARNAQKRVDPQRVLPGARSVIVLSASYHRTAEQAEPSAANLPALPAGVVARYARYEDYHEVLGQRLRELTAFVNTLETGTRSLWYVDTGPLLERDLAQRAGIGFIGKHTNLIGRAEGNWIFLAEILTTLSLAPDAPGKNHCGHCTRCLAACPTGAITAPFRLDARRCISYLTIELKGSIPVELRPALGNRIYGCDDCLAVCPWNRFAQEGRLMKTHARPDLETPDLLNLLALDEDGFRRRFAHTPLLRTKRRGLLRNVCVALGNVGDARALPALTQAASDPDPLIAEHAHWARNRILERVTERVGQT
ncbi:MAG TPA: tRNA epoxyqueuosine(34) reductase QueG [Verrucomicrobiae bacterium]|nr:tRNA epoxyqueuosine(34) reductase QueG [Verrucomicrobiae bacterium]